MSSSQPSKRPVQGQPPVTLSIIPSGDIPYSQEAEEATIGSVMMNPASIAEIVLFLNAEDFYILRHTYIWQAILRLRDRGEEIDYLTVVEELRATNQLSDIGGPSYLTQLINSMPTSMHAVVYAKIVADAALRRRLMAVADDLKVLARDMTRPVGVIADEVERSVLDVTTRETSRGVITLAEGLSAYWDKIQLNKEVATDGLLGWPTGLKSLDAVWGGLRRGKVYLSTGVSGHGKTDTTLNIMLNVARMGGRVLFFSLDMAHDAIINKLIAIETGIPHAKIEGGQMSKAEWARYVDAQTRLEKYHLSIYEKTKGLDREPWDRIVSVSESVARRTGLDLIAIDYTMLVSSGGRYKGDSYSDKVYGVMNLPVLAQKFTVPVLALHQMNKRRIKSEAYRPEDMEYLEYGGENAADAIIAWYKKSRVAGYENTDRTKLEGIILKNRFGPDNITLRFKHDGPTARVTDWPKTIQELGPTQPTEPLRHYLDDLDDRAYGDEE